MNSLIPYQHSRNLLETRTQVWYPPLREDKEKRESGEEDGCGTGNPPRSKGLREPDLLLRRSRPDVVTGCSACMGKSNVRGRGSSLPRGKQAPWQNAAATQSHAPGKHFPTGATWHCE